jgi:WD40 repeat protein
VILWDVAARKEKARFKGHTEFIRSIMYSPDDKTLASASDDCIKLWDVATGKERARLAGHTVMVQRDLEFASVRVSGNTTRRR